MTRIDRFGPWLALTWGILAIGTWARNGITAATTDSPPSLSTLLTALALTMTGIAVGVTLQVVVGLVRSRRPPRPDDAEADDAALWILPMGIGLLGAASQQLFSTLDPTDWLLLVVGSLASGFVIGALIGAPLRRYATTASRPTSPPVPGRPRY